MPVKGKRLDFLGFNQCSVVSCRPAAMLASKEDRYYLAAP
jgi:hypothetical protein